MDKKSAANAVEQWEAELDMLGASASRAAYEVHLISYPSNAPRCEAFHYLRGYLDGKDVRITNDLTRSIQLNRRDGYQAGYLSGIDSAELQIDDLIIKVQETNLPTANFLRVKNQLRKHRSVIVRGVGEKS